MKKRNGLILGILAALLLVIAMGSLLSGRYPIDLPQLLQLLCGIKPSTMPDNQYQIMRELVFSVRLPRMAAGMLIGMALTMSGTTFQAMFRNPLVSPELLGVMGGALCGLMLGFMLGFSLPLIQLMALGGGLIAVSITLLLAHAYRGDRLLILILSGIITGGLFVVIFKLLEYKMDEDKIMPNLIPWAMGDLGLAHGHDILLCLPPLALALVILLVCGKALNALTLGEEAATLGLNPTFWRLLAIVAATLAASLSVVMAGIIAWIGLVVPHLSRLMVGQDNRILLPVSALTGAGLLVLADDLTRIAMVRELPLSVTMALLGIPLFLILLCRMGKRECNL